MFGFLPSWVGDVMLILAFVAGPSGLIWGILQQKGANRKLVVEESGLSVTAFDAATAAALAEVQESRVDRQAMRGEIKALSEETEDLRFKQNQLRQLFIEVVRQNNIVLTPAQQKEFEDTRPRPRIKQTNE